MLLTPVIRDLRAAHVALSADRSDAIVLARAHLAMAIARLEEARAATRIVDHRPLAVAA